jgi:hypothetical protein
MTYIGPSMMLMNATICLGNFNGLHVNSVIKLQDKGKAIPVTGRGGP